MTEGMDLQCASSKPCATPLTPRRFECIRESTGFGMKRLVFEAQLCHLLSIQGISHIISLSPSFIICKMDTVSALLAKILIHHIFSKKRKERWQVKG
uniref:Macaca fascicularis brain cDNA clone: QflA-22613, similar to human hypothetical protein MGC22001 (MGC22001), mRNA, RefSeq: NM_153238.1 n=1 Tax=Macaca fascicularis TaxID=9541 RepID=I7G7E9_MACFA|nr:unnamed protein product [Macaca fascicularis]